MAALSIRSALGQIEQALHRVLRWKLLALRATVADLPALRALSTQASGANGTPEFTPVFVTSTGTRWEWISSSLVADDGVSTVKPTDVAVTAAGRWIATTSTTQTGYLAAVNYWQGETRKKEFQARILASRPSIAIVWESADNTERSTVPGAIYDYPCRFSIWCVDENLRDGYQAIFGSAYTYDANHPGAIAILGDVKKTLADENKRQVGAGSVTCNALDFAGGVKVIVIGAEDVEDADLAERVIVLSLGVEVIGSVENPDAAAEHQTITSVYGQAEIVELHQQATLDPKNCLTSLGAYQFSPQMGLAATPTAGAALIANVAVSSSPAMNTFAAFTDTYCDLNPNGTFTYVAVTNRNAAPALTVGALRVGVVITDGAGIIAFQLIAATAANFGAANRFVPVP